MKQISMEGRENGRKRPLLQHQLLHQAQIPQPLTTLNRLRLDPLHLLPIRPNPKYTNLRILPPLLRLLVPLALVIQLLRIRPLHHVLKPPQLRPRLVPAARELSRNGVPRELRRVDVVLDPEPARVPLDVVPVRLREGEVRIWRRRGPEEAREGVEEREEEEEEHGEEPDEGEGGVFGILAGLPARLQRSARVSCGIRQGRMLR